MMHVPCLPRNVSKARGKGRREPPWCMPHLRVMHPDSKRNSWKKTKPTSTRPSGQWPGGWVSDCVMHDAPKPSRLKSSAPRPIYRRAWKSKRLSLRARGEARKSSIFLKAPWSSASDSTRGLGAWRLRALCLRSTAYRREHRARRGTPVDGCLAVDSIDMPFARMSARDPDSASSFTQFTSGK